MDIAGAKALKERLGPNTSDGTRADSADVPQDAPPIFHWTGVSQQPRDPAPEAKDDPGTPATLFRRVGLSFR